MRRQTKFVVTIAARDTAINRQKFNTAMPTLAKHMCCLGGECTITDGWWYRIDQLGGPTDTGTSYIIRVVPSGTYSDEVYYAQIKAVVHNIKQEYCLDIAWMQCDLVNCIDMHMEEK